MGLFDIIVLSNTNEDIIMICLFDEDEVQYSEHDIAWMNRDWEAVQKLADSFKEKPENEFFMILNNINTAKRELPVGNIDSYSKFAIDNMLSKHTDCIHAVYMSNMLLHGLSDQAHHNYIINAVPYGKRFAKAVKIEESYKDKFVIQLLMKFYKVNPSKATEYHDLLKHKGKLDEVLQQTKGFVTDDFVKSITKNVKEQKELKRML